MSTNASTRPTILFIINSLAGGGAERVMMELLEASEIFSKQFHIILVLLDIEQEAYTPPSWVTVYRLDASFSLLRSTRQLHALARKLRPSATLAFLTRANMASILVARVLGHAAIISERVNTSGHFAGGLSARLSKLMVRLLYPRADKVVAVSAGIADDLHDNYGVPRAKLLTIANPVSLERIRAASERPVEPLISSPYAIAISRLSVNKNAILTIDALAASNANLSLLILGQGEQRDAMLERAKTLGVSDRVVMPGFVANPYPYLKNAECYLSGSNAEGFPNGLVEALALGVPAISTNCPSGPSEILADLPREQVQGVLEGSYGILVPQNDPAAMGEAIGKILSVDRRQHYVIAGPERAAEYSVERARDSFWSAITSCL